jgi:hypothetical protein
LAIFAPLRDTAFSRALAAVIYYDIYQPEVPVKRTVAKPFAYPRNSGLTEPNPVAQAHSTWKSFFKLRHSVNVPSAFMSDRGDGPPQERELFE